MRRFFPAAHPAGQKYRGLMNFLSNVLREDGGFEYKKVGWRCCCWRCCCYWLGCQDVLLSSSVAVGPLAAACHSSSSCVAQRTPHLPLTRNHHAGRPRPHHHLQANAHATSPPLPR